MVRLVQALLFLARSGSPLVTLQGPWGKAVDQAIVQRPAGSPGDAYQAAHRLVGHAAQRGRCHHPAPGVQMVEHRNGFRLRNLQLQQRGPFALGERLAAVMTAQLANPIFAVSLAHGQVASAALPVKGALRGHATATLEVWSWLHLSPPNGLGLEKKWSKTRS